MAVARPEKTALLLLLHRHAPPECRGYPQERPSRAAPSPSAHNASWTLLPSLSWRAEGRPSGIRTGTARGRPAVRRRRVRRVILGWVGAVVVLASACATQTFEPAAPESVPLRERAEVKVDGAVEVRAAVPGPEETQALFGAPLYDRGMQPVWIEVVNASPELLRFAPVGIDRFYFSPIEVAYIHRGGFSKADREQMERRYHDMAMSRWIPAGETRSGFVFTHVDPGTKGINVDLFGPTPESDHFFIFFIQVPGFEPDHAAVDFDALYDESRLKRLDEAGLRAALAALPCCTTAPAGDEPGIPLNVVLVGEGEALLSALLRAGWNETSLDAARGASERNPHWDGRPADAVFRLELGKTGDRNQLRLWLTPMQVDGVPVWLGQITGIVGGFLNITRLDPNLDAPRNYVLQSLWYGQALAQFAWLNGGYAEPIPEANWNPLAETYFTDGSRLVLWPSGAPIALVDTRFVDWDGVPPL